MPASTERKVLHALFRYTDEGDIERFAMRGETVELSAKETARGDKLGALGPVAEDPAPEVEEEPLGDFPADGDEEAQDAWVAKANAKEVHAEAEAKANAGVTEALLAAEGRRAKPRSTVEDGLRKLLEAQASQQ